MKVSIVLALCALAIVPIAFSQTSPGTIRATVDFDFVVGGLQLPAGEYIFAFDSGTNLMHARNVNTHEGVRVFTRDVIDKSMPTENKLVFKNKKGKHVLQRVFSEHAGHVHELVAGTEEKETG